MALEQQQDDSQEGLRRKRLRDIAAQQEQEMGSKVPEKGVEEVSMTQIPGRAALIGKLKQEMPVAGEVADVVVPEDVEDFIPLVKQGKSAMKMAGKVKRLFDPESAAELIRKRRGDSAAEKFLTSSPEEQKKIYSEILKGKSEAKPGPALDYSKMQTPQDSRPMWKQKFDKKKEDK